jgi:hypothetical protein
MTKGSEKLRSPEGLSDPEKTPAQPHPAVPGLAKRGPNNSAHAERMQ